MRESSHTGRIFRVTVVSRLLSVACSESSLRAASGRKLPIAYRGGSLPQTECDSLQPAALDRTKPMRWTSQSRPDTSDRGHSVPGPRS
jgi:hypothetical protein